MLKKLSVATIGVILLSGLAFSGAAMAQDAGIKIAVVQMQVIQQRALAWQDLAVKLREAQQNVINEFQPRQQQLEAEAQALQQQQAILAQDAFQVKLAEFEEKRGVLLEESNAKQLMVQQAYASASNKIVGKIREIILEITKEFGYQLILDQSATDPTIISASSEIMITDLVVTRLDVVLPTAEFVLSAPQ